MDLTLHTSITMGRRWCVEVCVAVCIAVCVAVCVAVCCSVLQCKYLDGAHLNGPDAALIYHNGQTLVC